MREVKALVASCSDCPFLDYIHERVKVSDGETFEEGWYCLHKRRRGSVAKLSQVEGAGLRTLNPYLEAAHGEPFPGNCPLPPVRRAAIPSGTRRLDLNPGSPAEPQDGA